MISFWYQIRRSQSQDSEILSSILCISMPYNLHREIYKRVYVARDFVVEHYLEFVDLQVFFLGMGLLDVYRLKWLWFFWYFSHLFFFLTETYTLLKVLFFWFFSYFLRSVLKLVSCNLSWSIYLRVLANQHYPFLWLKKRGNPVWRSRISANHW